MSLGLLKKSVIANQCALLVWQSVPLLTEITVLFLVKSLRLKEEH